MDVLKKKINNVLVTILKTDKFKSVAGRLYFKTKVTRKMITERWILRSMLIESCKKYDTSEKLYKKTLEEYDAYFSSASQRVGNYEITSFSFSSLIDKYTKQGNLDEVVDTFCEIIFNPLVKNNAFDKDTFDIILKSRKSTLEKIKEDSSSYAERMVLKNLNQDKPYTFMSEIKYLDEVTPESLYQDYQDMLNNSEVELVLAGDIDFNSDFIKKITDNIKKNKTFNDELLIKNDDEKENKKIIEEQGSGTQNIINQVLYLKNVNDFELNYVAPLYRIILGGGAFSRLFSVIREENSLSYYSFARLEKDDALMFVIMGIEKENFNKAYDLTLEVIDSMKNVSEEELVHAKETLITSLLETQDRILNIIGTYYTGKLFKLPDNDEIIENINKVTKDNMKEFSAKVKPSICYFLKGE